MNKKTVKKSLKNKVESNCFSTPLVQSRETCISKANSLYVHAINERPSCEEKKKAALIWAEESSQCHQAKVQMHEVFLLYMFNILKGFFICTEMKKTTTVSIFGHRKDASAYRLTCTSIKHSMTAVYCYVWTHCPKTACLSLQGCHLKVNWGAIKTTGMSDAPVFARHRDSVHYD